MGRYSHSKIDTFKTCPKKYDYNYLQDLNPLEDSIHLLVGKLFHGAMEASAKHEDAKPFYDEFADIVRSGALPACHEDTLKIVVEEYLKYFFDVDKSDKVLLVEEKFEYLTNTMDVISGQFDKVYERNGLVYLKDYKTTINHLKYTLDDVTFNRQLNFYALVLEELYGLTPRFLEIDEVCIHPLESVPLNADKTPSCDTRKLAYVTYESYLEALTLIGMESDPKYYNVLRMLKERGHPLFKRITVPMNTLTRQNIFEQEYLGAIETIEHAKMYRVKGPLCAYCAYQEICSLELQGGNGVLVDRLKKAKFKPAVDPNKPVETEDE